MVNNGYSDSAASSVTITAGSGIYISGYITFDFVPTSAFSGLDYSNQEERPARAVAVEAIRVLDSQVITSTTTDSSGHYSVYVPVDTSIFIRAKARILKTGNPSWDFQVVDNTSDKALYVMDSAQFNTGNSDINNKNLNAASGWGTSSYTATRVAAPFAILDTVYKAYNKVLEANALADFPQLLINWSKDNIAIYGDETIGQIETSFYSDGEMYILGKEDNDTDEYDDHVIAHEWCHYMEDEFSRSDSIGGPHGGEMLDPRVAFGEGFGNAFSAIATDDAVYIDTMSSEQGATGLYMDLENNNDSDPKSGWFSEASIQHIIYDLYDSIDDGVDIIAMGFGPIYDVLAGKQKTAESFTTILSFASFLKEDNPAMTSEINALLQDETISSTAIDQWDSTETETNNGNDGDALPVYIILDVDGPLVNICVNGSEGNYNKLSNRKFFYFQIITEGSYSITAMPDANGDPDIFLYRKGAIVEYADNEWDGETETLTTTITSGTYVGEIYHYNHIVDTYALQECFSVTLSSN